MNQREAINRTLLKEKATKNGMTLNDLSKEININEATLYRKLNGKNDFSRHELVLIKKTLHLSLEEMDRIFFTP